MDTQIIGRKDISNLKYSDYDFIARIDTPYHLINCRAYIRSRFTVGKYKGLLLVGKHPTSSYLIDKDNIDMGANVRLDRYYYDADRPSQNNGTEIVTNIKERMLYIIHPDRPWAFFSLECRKMGRKVTDVVIDDGIGAYEGPLKWAVTTAEDSGSVIKGAKYLIGRIAGRVLISLAGIKVENFSFFRKGSFASYEVGMKIRQEIEEQSKNIEGISFEPKSIVYISQPFADRSFYEDTFHMAENVMEKYSANGYSIYIKLHPREKNNEMWTDKGYKMLPDVAIENIIAASSSGPDLIIGWTSTALITLSVLWDIPCMSLAQLYLSDRKNSDLMDFVKLVMEQRSRLPKLTLVGYGGDNLPYEFE